MKEQNETLDSVLIEKSSATDEQNIISVKKFIFLTIISFGTYELWWIYKEWRFYKQQEKLDIMPAARAIFSIFFLTALFNKILYSAQSKGYSGTYSSTGLFVGFFVLNLLGRLPDPFWLISLLSFAPFIPPLKALNFAKLNSPELNVIEQDSFSARQIALIVVGSIFWILVVFGLMAE